MGLAGCVCGGWGGGGEAKGGGGRQTDRERERVALTICCFSTVLQVTAVEVKPI